MTTTSDPTPITKREVIEMLRGLREQLDKVERYVSEPETGPSADEPTCCQQRGAQWFELCDICLGTDEARERLGSIEELVTFLYLEERTLDCEPGPYASFVENMPSLQRIR